MKVLILCGGHGTRLGELTTLEPKPMVRIGTLPILMHIMEIYSANGFNDFVLLTGYASQKITKFFLNLRDESNDISINMSTGKIKQNTEVKRPWKVRVINTGLHSNTATRLKKVKNIFTKNENFLCTYGDGLANINIKELNKFHIKNNNLATVTVVRPQSRFGALKIKNNKIVSFTEKPKDQMEWINGGFFVFNTGIFDFFQEDDEPLETGPLKRLAEANELNAFFHEDFWQCMDTPRDFEFLTKLASRPKAPWLMGF